MIFAIIQSNISSVTPICYILVIAVAVGVLLLGRWVEGGKYFSSSKKMLQKIDHTVMDLIEKHSINWIAMSLAAAFVFFVFSSVVLTRHHYEDTFAPVPLWSYYEVIFHGRTGLIWDNILNAALMVPFGFLISAAIRDITWKHVAITTLCIELFFELCQLIFSVGLFEWDDMIHGCIGAVIGMGIYRFIVKRIVKHE